MKRYILSIAAVVIAFCAIAFKLPVNEQSMVTFRFNPGSPENYSQERVQDKQFWSAGSQSCDEEEDKACTIQVPVAQTTDSGTKLGSSVTITAAEGGEPGKYRVTGGTHISNIKNKD